MLKECRVKQLQPRHRRPKGGGGEGGNVLGVVLASDTG